MKSSRTTLEKSLVAPAGEYYVLAMLHLQGFLAALAPRGTEKADILVVDPMANSVIASIQVKARTRGKDRGWHMRKHHENWVSDGLFYAFVDFEPMPYKVYVIPSRVIARAVAENHKQWLALPNKKGGKHNDHEMRRIVPDFSVYKTKLDDFPSGWMDRYENAWAQLKQVPKTSPTPA